MRPQRDKNQLQRDPKHYKETKMSTKRQIDRRDARRPQRLKTKTHMPQREPKQRQRDTKQQKVIKRDKMTCRSAGLSFTCLCVGTHHVSWCKCTSFLSLQDNVKSTSCLFSGRPLLHRLCHQRKMAALASGYFGFMFVQDSHFLVFHLDLEDVFFGM